MPRDPSSSSHVSSARGGQAGRTQISTLLQVVSVTAARVLIVEDDELQRNLLERVFARDDFIVRTAADGREALQLLEDEPPDLLVLDIMLPWVNGIEVLVTVRQHPRLARVPVLIATGSATSAYDLRDYAPLLVLHKPFELSSVVPAAERLLNRTQK